MDAKSNWMQELFKWWSFDGNLGDTLHVLSAHTLTCDSFCFITHH